ncbi:cyclophilin family peptidyl-prolyl cis-trans isomerase [Arcicella aurantiaca]|uniref:peptidylprolyl isomerase n=2 Tax=Arcicella aurantiaca TaxID=591202 RepID=A0A316EFA7_9BACT|nr:cyclophilin family peptidyl-prolyl cis-trans isomerase [Arcicella aurantiaca]
MIESRLSKNFQMTILKRLFIFVLTVVSLFSCKKDLRLFDKDPKTFLTEYGKENPEKEVVIKTVGGDITIKLYEKTPLHRANFVRLVKSNYYIHRTFYRNVYLTAIQGGGEYEDQLDYLVPPEYFPELTHKRGAVAMARYDEGNPEKASSPTEFFIVTNANEAKKLNGLYVVFGEVTKGMDVVDKIQQAPEYYEKPAIPVFFRIEMP